MEPFAHNGVSGMNANTKGIEQIMRRILSCLILLSACSAPPVQVASNQNTLEKVAPSPNNQHDPEEWASQCREILHEAVEGLEKPRDWGEPVTPIVFDHFGHWEKRIGVRLRGRPPSFDVAVWIAPEADLGLYGNDWRPVTHWGEIVYFVPEDEGLDSNKRYVRASNASRRDRTKFRGYVELTAPAEKYKSLSYGYVKEKGNCQALISISSNDRVDNRLGDLFKDKMPFEYIAEMAPAFEQAVDACLDLGVGLPPLEPFSETDQPPICDVHSRVEAVSALNNPDSLPPLVVRIKIPSFTGRREENRFPKVFGRPQIIIADAANGEVVRTIKLPKQDINKWIMGSESLLVFDDAFSSQGDYIIKFKWPQSSQTIWEQRVRVDAGDVEIVVLAWIAKKDGEQKSGYPYWLPKLTFTRVQVADGEVKLLRNWDPKPSMIPEYIIWNKLDKVIHGLDFRNRLLGHVVSRGEGAWNPAMRGRRAATYDYVSTILPDHVGRSWEGEFMEHPELFTPGEYKYVVRYSLVKENHYNLPFPEPGKTAVLYMEQFELSDVFSFE